MKYFIVILCTLTVYIEQTTFSMYAKTNQNNAFTPKITAYTTPAGITYINGQRIKFKTREGFGYDRITPCPSTGSFTLSCKKKAQDEPYQLNPNLSPQEKIDLINTLIDFMAGHHDNNPLGEHT